MPEERTYRTAEEAERAYNAHVAESGGYPWLTQADFYSRVRDPNYTVPDEVPAGLIPGSEHDLDILLTAGITDEAQDNNGW